MAYRVMRRLRYPARADQDRVRLAGGLHRLTADERLTLMLVERRPGDIVEDVPRESIAWLLAQGCLEVVMEDADDE